MIATFLFPKNNNKNNSRTIQNTRNRGWKKHQYSTKLCWRYNSISETPWNNGDSVKAQELAKRYLAVNFPEAQIKTCTVDPVKLNEVTVTATVEVKPLFMKLFGVESKTIQATVYNHVG